MRALFTLLVVTILAGVLPAHAAQPLVTATGQSELSEVTGYEPAVVGEIPVISPAKPRSVAVLMIPESTADVVGMYDPYDGTYMGDMITANPGFSTPINAVQGPDGNIYVSDQIADAVFVFNPDGEYLYTYADASDGLNNIRGIAFRDGELFVTSGDDYVARFNGPHSRIPDFINDGSEPFDIFFLPDGSALLSDIYSTTDNVRLYDAAGVFQRVIFTTDFPEQIMDDPALPGAFLNVAFSADVITDFDLDGTIWSSVFYNAGRGIYRLGNGNLLATAGDGVYEVDPATGAIIELEHAGSGRFIELYTETSGVGASEGRTQLLLGTVPTLCADGVRVQFALPEAGHVDLGVFDATGRRVTRLTNGWTTAGTHLLEWNRTLGDGAAAPDGVYFVRLRSSGVTQVQRIILTR